MPVCFDTALLLKLYTVEPDTPDVIALAASLAEPVFLTDFNRVELSNALHRKHGRHEITAGDVAKALAHVRNDLRAGVLRWVEPDWKRVFAATEQLCARHAAITHCRTLDAIHAGLALELKASALATTDVRQAALARAAGLRVLVP